DAAGRVRALVDSGDVLLSHSGITPQVTCDGLGRGADHRDEVGAVPQAAVADPLDPADQTDRADDQPAEPTRRSKKKIFLYHR
ncbi:hypothetical protein, partial [Enterococcus faecium]|uniref:hypothetical protein n=1 Tax=Enterococcus faecium TaxID=1352 RepID=UPI001C9D1A68